MSVYNVVVLFQTRAVDLHAHTLPDWLVDFRADLLPDFIHLRNNLTGHSDVVMGLVSLNREDLYEKLKFLQNGESSDRWTVTVPWMRAAPWQKRLILGLFGLIWREPRLCLALGGVPSPFDCYLCNRGLKTLHLRMERHFKNAMAAATFLQSDPRVERVIFPGRTLSALACPRLPQFEFSPQFSKSESRSAKVGQIIVDNSKLTWKVEKKLLDLFYHY